MTLEDLSFIKKKNSNLRIDVFFPPQYVGMLYAFLCKDNSDISSDNDTHAILIGNDENIVRVTAFLH